MVGREEYGVKASAYVLKHTISSVKHGSIIGTEFFGDMTTDRKSRINSKMY